MRLFAAAGLAASPAFAQTFIIVPSTQTSLSEGVRLSADGQAGIIRYTERWQAPNVVSPLTGFYAYGTSPDGAYALGADETTGAARLHLASSTIESISVPAGYGSTYLTASSADNSVVAGYGTNASWPGAFRWTSADGPQAIAPPASRLGVSVSDCSANGLSLAGMSLGSDGFTTYAMRWTSTGGSEDLLGAANQPMPLSVSTAVSADGATFVGFRGSFLKAFRWTAPGVVQSLHGVGALGETMQTSASEVSGDGSRIGGYSLTAFPEIERSAIVWDGTGEPSHVADILTRIGCTDHLGYRLMTVDSVSTDGRTVSGRCVELDQPPHLRKKIGIDIYVATLPPPCWADLGKQGGLPGSDGLLNNNDFVIFIDRFFEQSPVADFGKQGGLPGRDGILDNNDFVIFIDRFFDGCPQ